MYSWKVVYKCLSRKFRYCLKDYIDSVLDRSFGKDGSSSFTTNRPIEPGIAKYYSGSEVEAALEDTGFADVCVYRRHGFSWTVVGITR
jgi:hypothetical protein